MIYKRLLLLLAVAVVTFGPQLNAQVVYENNFDDGTTLGPEWGRTDGWEIQAMDSGADGSYADFGFSGPNFLRSIQAGSASAQLALTGLPPHTHLDLDFKLASIDSPDTEPFKVLVDGVEVFNKNFLAWQGRNPDDPNIFGHNLDTGAELAINQELGYAHNDDNRPDPNDLRANNGGWSLDSGWDMGLLTDGTFNEIPHTADSVTISFIGELSSGPNDESFAIDDVRVRAIPEPSTLLLLGIGLAAIGRLVRRRRR